ncbi:hypothetical protein M8C21_013614 [Ambrosia artemisiifolia]|uniref:Uncharacterized protein n=1 Tax=Ambrosia artemisiifolia TaxID=4212 RepID=A0AAD5GE64_AMBAR|nr:hypothetical protein M8C21_013614 [Ambrosia artemisiifolia]
MVDTTVHEYCNHQDDHMMQQRTVSGLELNADLMTVPTYKLQRPTLTQKSQN